MTILLLNKVAISAVITQVPPGTSTQGTIGIYDLATGGKGSTDADNVIVIAVARVNEHSETSAQKTHGYMEAMGLFTRIGGTLVGPYSGTFSVNAISDTGFALGLIFDISGSQILVKTTVPGVENGPGTYSGVLEIYMAD